jgi:uncharacterized membrane protein
MKPAIAVPLTAALIYRAWSRKSLTPVGIATAFLTAVAHAVHPWSVFFVLLGVFFLAGTAVTKVASLHFHTSSITDWRIRSNMTSKLSSQSPQAAHPEARDRETISKY